MLETLWFPQITPITSAWLKHSNFLKQIGKQGTFKKQTCPIAVRMKLFLTARREDSNAMVQLIMHYSHELEKHG